jgi:hypothetical protein
MQGPLKASPLVSPRQKAANQRNARLSTGPKTPDGRLRASINAFKHGLTTPINNSLWGNKVPELAQLIAESGFGQADATELAEAIADYERNLVFQRARFLALQSGKTPEVVLSAQAQQDLDLANKLAHIQAQGQVAQLGLGKSLTRHIEKFFRQIGERQARQDVKENKQNLDNAARYLRRAARKLVVTTQKVTQVVSQNEAN